MKTRTTTREKTMRMAAWTIATLVGALALGCGSSTGTPVDPGSTPGPIDTSGAGGQVGTHQGAIVRVELRGQDELAFEQGGRVALDQFVVNFGGVRLLRDISDPAAAQLDLSPRRLPILGPEGSSTLDRFIIGGDKLQGGFRGIRLELSPPSTGGTTPADGSNATILVRGVYTLSTSPDSKSDSAGSISPNPAPIQPTGRAIQPMTSVTQVPFVFMSSRVEDLLVGFADDLAAGRTLVVIFRANRWFDDQVTAVLRAEARARAQLGISSTTLFRLGGEGYVSDDPIVAAAGLALESNILDTIGIEVH